MPRLQANFETVVKDYTAGDPMDENIRWTNLTPLDISVGLEDLGTPVSTFVVRNLLSMAGFSRRKAQKNEALGTNPFRNLQFQNIAWWREDFLDRGLPVVSIDTKKKELLGNFYRDGKLYTREPIQTFDHDFPSAGNGRVIPHGIFDIGKNLGHITLGTSHDTSQFASDSLILWWRKHAQSRYPNANELLLFCDTGGSNGTGPMFKEALQKVANRTGLIIRVAHYPPYTSKYNPIEHRMFPHVTRACQGVVFKSLEIIRDLMRATHTVPGLQVTVDILKKVYKTGRKLTKEVKDSFNIEFEELLPKWNYRVLPQPT